ncbi:MAG: T9SS type A sorting domain-containing protein, partial [Bacteroidales bacterium]|nr:T9SS type A sorting domain-containing protein [Bacteroidales bacterium]
SFDIVLKNIGSVNASNVTATLTCDKPDYVNITTSTINVGNVSANSDITLEDAFAFTVCDSVPNNTNVRFFVSCTDGTDTWESKFDVNIFAPEFEIVKPNGLELNPGDSETVEFTIINKGGSSSNDINFSILLPEEITASQNQFNIPGLSTGEETDIEVTLTVSENAALGYAYEMPFIVSSGRYSVNGSYAIIVGNVTEDFESGDFSKFNWEFDGNPNWEIATGEAYEGQYCAKSGAIGDLTSTTLKITIDVKAQSEFSFYKKVSSESGYDFLKFYIDGQEKDKWSGEDNWSEESFILTEGLRTLEWTYSKDVYAESGQDCAWVDNIKFPPTAVIVDVETVEEKDIAIYPNPARDFVKVSTDNGQQTTVRIYNTLGMLVDEFEMNSGEIEINVSDYKSGIYFINISNEESNVTKKIVVE